MPAMALFGMQTAPMLQSQITRKDVYVNAGNRAAGLFEVCSEIAEVPSPHPLYEKIKGLPSCLILKTMEGFYIVFSLKPPLW